MATLADRTILVTGATSGTGRAGAAEWHRLGATVVIGSRSQARYEEVAAQLGVRRVEPFVADLADATSIERALERLDRTGIRLTDVVNCAAGGLETLLRPLLRAAVGIRRQPPGPEREAALARHREALIGLVAETAPATMSVNFKGPRELISRLLPTLPDGARVVAYSSIMSTALELGACPIFYRSVAESKVALERWLGELGLIRPGLQPVVLIAHLIADTSMGALIDRNLVPLMPEADQREFRANYVSIANMTTVVSRLLIGAPPSQPGAGLPRLYVVAPGLASPELDPRVLAFTDCFPF